MGALEARVRILTNNTRRSMFAPQDIVSCSQFSQGCAGGFPYLIAGKYGMVSDYRAAELTSVQQFVYSHVQRLHANNV